MDKQLTKTENSQEFSKKLPEFRGEAAEEIKYLKNQLRILVDLQILVKNGEKEKKELNARIESLINEISK